MTKYRVLLRLYKPLHLEVDANSKEEAMKKEEQKYIKEYFFENKQWIVEAIDAKEIEKYFIRR